jgi:hypothetical protein
MKISQPVKIYGGTRILREQPGTLDRVIERGHHLVDGGAGPELRQPIVQQRTAAKKKSLSRPSNAAPLEFLSGTPVAAFSR